MKVSIDHVISQHTEAFQRHGFTVLLLHTQTINYLSPILTDEQTWAKIL